MSKSDRMPDIIMLPGFGGSDDIHWQTRWQVANPSMRRFQPRDWDQPKLFNWINAIERAVVEASEPPILIAHSLACLAVAHWQARSSTEIAGAFLVAVPDPDSDSYPSQADGFADVPTLPFRFPALIVASSDDPFASMAYVHQRASQWGTEIVEVGLVGHIGSTSGVGDWDQGLRIFQAFATKISIENSIEQRRRPQCRSTMFPVIRLPKCSKRPSQNSTKMPTAN